METPDEFWKVVTREELIAELERHPDVGAFDPFDPRFRYPSFHFNKETGAFQGIEPEPDAPDSQTPEASES